MPSPFILVTPATRGLSLALTRHFLKTTKLPVYATHRQNTADEVKKSILSPESLSGVDPDRLKLLSLDLESEESIENASKALSESLKDGLDEGYLHTGFFTGGILIPEKSPADLKLSNLQKVFQVNVLSHLLLIKHFSKFLPTQRMKIDDGPSKWVHVSARVGSVSDNRKGGWYSYRSSKSALNQANHSRSIHDSFSDTDRHLQVVKTFDLHLQMKSKQGICIGVHPGSAYFVFVFAFLLRTRLILVQPSKRT